MGRIWRDEQTQSLNAKNGFCGLHWQQATRWQQQPEKEPLWELGLWVLFEKIFAPVFGGKILDSFPSCQPSLCSACFGAAYSKWTRTWFPCYKGLQEGKVFLAPFQAAPLKVLYIEKGAGERKKKREKGREKKRSRKTKLKEIKTVLCKIVTAVSVFIGCFFWLQFFSNCGSHEQGGVWHGRAPRWRREEDRARKERRRAGAGWGGSQLCTALGGDTHQSISFW